MQFISQTDSDKLYGYNDRRQEQQCTNQHHQMVCQEMTAQAITNNEDWWRLKHRLKSGGAGTNAAIIQQLHAGVRERVKEEKDKQRRRSLSPAKHFSQQQRRMNMAAAMVAAELGSDDDASLNLSDGVASEPPLLEGDELHDSKWYKRGSISKILPEISNAADTIAKPTERVGRASRRQSPLPSFLRPTSNIEDGTELLCDFGSRPRRNRSPNGQSSAGNEGEVSGIRRLFTRTSSIGDDEEEVLVSDKQGFSLIPRRNKNYASRLSWVSYSSSSDPGVDDISDRTDREDANSFFGGVQNDYVRNLHHAASMDVMDTEEPLKGPAFGRKESLPSTFTTSYEAKGSADAGFFQKQKEALLQSKDTIEKNFTIFRGKNQQGRGTVLENFRPKLSINKQGRNLFGAFLSNNKEELRADTEASEEVDHTNLETQDEISEPAKENQFVPDPYSLVQPIGLPVDSKEILTMIGFNNTTPPITNETTDNDLSINDEFHNENHESQHVEGIDLLEEAESSATNQSEEVRSEEPTSAPKIEESVPVGDSKNNQIITSVDKSSKDILLFVSDLEISEEQQTKEDKSIPFDVDTEEKINDLDTTADLSVGFSDQSQIDPAKSQRSQSIDESRASESKKDTTSKSLKSKSSRSAERPRSTDPASPDSKGSQRSRKTRSTDRANPSNNVGRRRTRSRKPQPIDRPNSTSDNGSDRSRRSRPSPSKSSDCIGEERTDTADSCGSVTSDDAGSRPQDTSYSSRSSRQSATGTRRRQERKRSIGLDASGSSTNTNGIRPSRSRSSNGVPPSGSNIESAKRRPRRPRSTDEMRSSYPTGRDDEQGYGRTQSNHGNITSTESKDRRDRRCRSSDGMRTDSNPSNRETKDRGSRSTDGKRSPSSSAARSQRTGRQRGSPKSTPSDERLHVQIGHDDTKTQPQKSKTQPSKRESSKSSPRKLKVESKPNNLELDMKGAENPNTANDEA